MKFKILFYGLLAGSMLVQSCNKSADENSPEAINALIKTIMYRYADTINYNYTLQYDSQQRLSEMTISHVIGSSTYHLKVEYKYSADSVLVIYTNTDEQTVMETDIYRLNTNGLATTKEITMNGILSSLTYYVYNDAGYMIQDSTEYLSTAVLRIVNHNTISEGNRTTCAKRTENFQGIENQQTTFSYLSGKSNTVGDVSMGIKFLGKQNTNPVSSATFTPSPAVGPNPITYTYEFDSQGRIIQNSANNNLITSYTYY